MSNAGRRARKRAGEKFDYASKVKVGTPLTERAWFAGLVPGTPRTRFEGAARRRSWSKRVRALEARGLPLPQEMKDEYDEALLDALVHTDAEDHGITYGRGVAA